MIVTDFLIVVLASVVLSTSALAEEPMLLPKAEVLGNVTYVTGGIGEDETAAMRGVAKSYQLEIVFVQKLKEQEQFISDVKVKIQDAQNNSVLDITTEGPFLLANLPNGKYVITAEFNNLIKRQQVSVNAKKHQKVVFWWPFVEQPEIEYESE